MAKQTFTTGQVLTAAQVNSLQSNDFNQTVSVKTAAYTLVAADKGTRIEFNTSGSVTCTVNSGLFDAGDTLVIQNRGAGVVTVTAGTATVNTSATLALSQYDAGTLYFVSNSASIFFNTDAGGGSPLTTKGDLYTFSTVDARLGVGTNGQYLQADSSTATGLKWAAASTGKVVQITQGTYSTNTSTSSTSFVDTGLSATITPTSASNQVLVFVNLNGIGISTNNSGHWSEWQLNCRSGAATQSIGARVGVNVATNASSSGMWGVSTIYLDSPASTSSLTYKVQFLVSNATAVAFIAQGSPVSTITLMEVTP